MYGVNLGGWLVLEKWITPALFKGYEVQDERAFMREADAHRRLVRHREAFVTEDDLAWLSQHHITAVRVPVGYWLFGDEAPYEGCVQQLDWLVQRAAAHNLQVIIDLHRAPGAQDGHDTGGEVTPFSWFYDASLREQTLSVLERIAERYGHYDHVWGIGVLNEPRVTWRRMYTVRRFYQAAYARMTPYMRQGMAIIFSDGFLPRFMSGAIRATHDNPAVMDVHFYHFSVPLDGWRSLAGHLRKAGRRSRRIVRLQQKQPVIIGEWSGVISGRKMRRVPQSVQYRFEEEYIRVQQAAHQPAAGQFYWNYKTEHPGIWNYRSLVESERVDTSEVQGV